MPISPILAERIVNSRVRISDAIELCEEAVADAAEVLVARLVDEGAIRIHRNWSASEERKLICKAAARAAALAVITHDWCDLPAEVKWLHVDRYEQ